jgi:hypothetical protein
MKHFFVLTLAAFVSLAAPAAELGSSAPQLEAPKKAAPKSIDRHEFTGLTLQGQLKKPDLSYIYKRQGLRQEQIVNIPDNFNDEIVEGAAQF